MKQRRKAWWIANTSVLIALLIVLQAATTSLAAPLLTGSIVNFMLVVSVMLCGITSGITVAAVSPVAARLLGIGPLWILIPFIIAGNLALVLVWHILGRMPGRPRRSLIPALLSAAAVKFLVLYLGIVKLAVPVLLKLPEQQAAVISGMFSLSQLATALLGGGLALLVLPVLKRALEKSQG